MREPYPMIRHACMRFHADVYRPLTECNRCARTVRHRGTTTHIVRLRGQLRRTFNSSSFAAASRSAELSFHSPRSIASTSLSASTPDGLSPATGSSPRCESSLRRWPSAVSPGSDSAFSDPSRNLVTLRVAPGTTFRLSADRTTPPAAHDKAGKVVYRASEGGRSKGERSCSRLPQGRPKVGFT